MKVVDAVNMKSPPPAPSRAGPTSNPTGKDERDVEVSVPVSRSYVNGGPIMASVARQWWRLLLWQ